MQIELKPRTEENVRIYFERTQDPVIQHWLPQASQTVEQAVEAYRQSLAPGAASYGRTIWADGAYVGDIWCYGIHTQQSPDAMVSYCIFEKQLWGKGIAAKPEIFKGNFPTSPCAGALCLFEILCHLKA